MPVYGKSIELAKQFVVQLFEKCGTHTYGTEEKA